MESPIFGLRGAAGGVDAAAVGGAAEAGAGPWLPCFGLDGVSALPFDSVSDMGRSSRDARMVAREDGERGPWGSWRSPSLIVGVWAHAAWRRVRTGSGDRVVAVPAGRDRGGASGASFQVRRDHRDQVDPEPDQPVPDTGRGASGTEVLGLRWGHGARQSTDGYLRRVHPPDRRPTTAFCHPVPTAPCRSCGTERAGTVRKVRRSGACAPTAPTRSPRRRRASTNRPGTRTAMGCP